MTWSSSKASGGKIEEITLTYVVVNIWDQRRLIVPITYFLEKPFRTGRVPRSSCWRTSNSSWTTTSPIEDLRQKLTDILNQSKFWDRRANVLQVTDAREHTVQLRALVSAP